MTAKALRYHRFGNPLDVLQLDQIPVDPSLGPDQVLVRWVMAPVNPLDINRIEGTYAIRNELPHIGGSEGAGIVEKIGSSVSDLKAGDKVISLTCPTWVEMSVVEADQLLKVDPRLDWVSAATLLINPPTAYLMLTEYESLSAGDYVIQNSANSAVGRCVIQEAKAMGLKTINIIRDRPEVKSLKDELAQLGADFIFTEEEFKQNGRNFCSTLDKSIKLACNGVGGRSALNIAAVLGRSATCVTYGGMSKRPAEFSTGSLVFNDLKVAGVSVTNFILSARNRGKVAAMFVFLQVTAPDLMNRAQGLIVSGGLRPAPHQVHALPAFHSALARHLQGRAGKQLVRLAPAHQPHL